MTHPPNIAKSADALGFDIDVMPVFDIDVQVASPSMLLAMDRLLARLKPPRKPRQPLPPPPDGLRTPAEAARKLRCSPKTLAGHVASGALRYVLIGHGRKRRRMMFTDADIDEFIANQTRKDHPCPSTPSRVRHTSTSTSASEVIAFTGQPRPRPGAKPKK
jgi:Helix-turn-helix domain